MESSAIFTPGPIVGDTAADLTNFPFAAAGLARISGMLCLRSGEFAFSVACFAVGLRLPEIAARLLFGIPG